MIYLDHAATTPVPRAVADAMYEVLTGQFGNPSSQYPLGLEMKRRVESWRRTVADALGCAAKHLFFTSCGTEADNWAVTAACWQNRHLGRHIVTTAVEHSAVLEACRWMERQGYEVTYLAPAQDGSITAEQVLSAVRPDTALVSCMLVNNETGAIFPVEEAARAIRRSKAPALLHVDAVQAFGKLPFTVKKLGADLLTLSGHKLHAPKGVGALYIRTGVVLPNFIDGGAQERGKRGGTEDIPGICGAAAAFDEACVNMARNAAYLTPLRYRLIAGLTAIPHTVLNGDPVRRLPGNVNVCFEGIEGESLLLLLDEKGIAASSGSACTSGSLDPSHVLLALGRPHEVAHGSLRLSLSHENRPEEIDYILEVLPGIVSYLRDMSPVWDELETGLRPHLI